MTKRILIERVENGWIVRQDLRTSDPMAMAIVTGGGVYVFQTMEQLLKHLPGILEQPEKE